MCIANISGVLGDMFRFVYSRVCCRLCMKKKKPQNSKDPINTENPHTSEETDADGNKIDKMGVAGVSQWSNKDGKKNDAKVVDDNEDLENEIKDDDEEEKVTVPLTITMIIITLYIILGAVIFNQFEGWSMIQSAYFCYITLATIGELIYFN